jgi:capsular polysaccharide export protein
MSIKQYTVLSLDPMYSPLHENIASIVAKKKYAVASCLTMKIYLPSFKFTLATKLIKANNQTISDDLLKKVNEIPTYHSAYVNKRENRSLNEDELQYMAKYYLALKEFIVSKGIDLVLIHNDTRWYHAIAVILCKELGIKYLVTEQGFIRPNTTVIDEQGINFKANLPTNSAVRPKQKYTVKHPHDSFVSMGVFGCFLLLHMVESSFNTQIKYFHNDYSLSKYFKRIMNKVNKKKRVEQKPLLFEKTVLLLLQLELDSQLLIYSEFNNNQEIISRLERQCEKSGFKLAIKTHPLDTSEYQINSGSIFVNGVISELSRQAKMVFTVNSSAALQVMKTMTPLYLLGDSIFDRKYVAEKVEMNCLDLDELESREVKAEDRKNFLNIILHNYLLHGAGFSFNKELLNEKLQELLCKPEACDELLSEPEICNG